MIKERENIKIIKNYTKLALNGKLINDKNSFKKSENPKISIVITIFNGEGFIRTALRSIQNQNFRDIEIIIVDDYSMDESVKLIKELMKEDQRIILIQNDANRGPLYTKSKGVLNAKGKYVMTLDVDDLYANQNVFSILYEKSEKENLDILGFSAIHGKIKKNKLSIRGFHNYFETSLITQPELRERAMIKNKKGKIISQRDVLWCYLFKTELYIKVIKEIEDKFFKKKNRQTDDILVFFLILRRAQNLRHIKNIFYINVQKADLSNNLMKFYFDEKKNIKYKCWGILSYAEFIFKKTDNSFEDKKFASYAMNNYLLYESCKKDIDIKNEVNEVCELFLKNEYIDNKLKDKINKYLNEINK